MAYVCGVRLSVWLAVETVEDCNGDAEKAAQLLALPIDQIKAALAYAKEFPDEISANREAGHQPLDKLETLVPNHSFLQLGEK